MGPASIITRVRHTFGRALRETGQALDRLGIRTQQLLMSKQQYGDDDPFIYDDFLSRHRQQMPLLKYGRPIISTDVAYLAPCSTMIGSVRIGAGSSVWYKAVLRADSCENGSSFEAGAAEGEVWNLDGDRHETREMTGDLVGGGIFIGEDSNVQDAAIITARVGHTIIGNGVTIGHCAQIHSATVEDFCLIGMGSIIAEGCKIESEAFIAAGAVLKENTTVKSGELWAGIPARKIRDLTMEQREKLHYQSSEYVKNATAQNEVMKLGGNMPGDVETRLALATKDSSSPAITSGQTQIEDNLQPLSEAQERRQSSSRSRRRSNSWPRRRSPTRSRRRSFSSTRNGFQLSSAAPIASIGDHQYRGFATANYYKKAKKKQGFGPGSAQDGRIVLYEQGTSTKNKGKAQLCMGCGTQIVSGGSTGMKGGAAAAEEAANIAASKKAEKMSRYLDVSDIRGGKLCQRCKDLSESDKVGGKAGNIWKAYDALRDVEPKVFLDQLKYVVRRRQFGMAIIVLDVTDSEHSQVISIRKAIGKVPLIAVWNKVDLLPRFNEKDQRLMEQKLGIRVINSFAVSAKTGVGLVDLAEHILENVQGRDVFVIGSANVGKSTMVKNLSKMIASGVFMRGSGRQANSRKDKASSLQVTGSHLPGTTLQAIRIPCFPSHRHALWDTPGIINGRAVQYRIFPSHLMEPLTRAQQIEVPTADNRRSFRLAKGYSLLIESTWMGRDADKNADDSSGDGLESGEECVLGRIDLDDTDGEQRTIGVNAYLHPALRIRVVPTEQAPDMAIIPKAHIERIKKKIQNATRQSQTGLQDEYQVPLAAYVTKENPGGAFTTSPKEQSYSGVNYLDVVFASLGWIAFVSSHDFTYTPRCVKNSLFSKRKSLYPVRFSDEEVDYSMPAETDLPWDSPEVKKRLDEAVKTGRQRGGLAKGVSTSGEFYGDEFDDDDWY